MLLLLGPFVAFFGTGYYSGLGAVTAEIYPTDIRATAQGLLLQRRPHRQRRRAVRGRLDRAVAWLRRGAIDRGRRLRRRRDLLDLDSGNERPQNSPDERQERMETNR